MRLYDYIMSFNDEEKEITVFDTNYSMEWYAYAYSDGEEWDKHMFELYKLVTVEKINEDGSVVVNMSELIENRLEELCKADLFYDCSVDEIMADMTNILAGSVSEVWLRKFVNSFKRVKEDELLRNMTDFLCAHEQALNDFLYHYYYEIDEDGEFIEVLEDD